MRHTLAPRTELGQHFLVDENVARNIAAAIAPASGDVILEIGGGEGALTRHLVGHGATIIVAELDPRAAIVLRSSFGDAIDVLECDALQISIPELADKHNVPSLRVVGNIPYQITSPLLFQLFESFDRIRDVVFMMQREVADRLVAKPRTKAYGILSVLTQFHGVPRKLFPVSPGCFLPPPAVQSSVIRIDRPAESRERVDPHLLRRIVRSTFGKRRKMLSNGLKDIVHDDAALLKIGARFDCSRRPEELSVDDFISLTDLVRAIGGTA